MQDFENTQSLINSESDQILNTGILAFEAQEFFVNEGDNGVSIGVVRTDGSEGSASIDFATIDGTATGNDYKSLTGTLFFGPGETKKIITIQIKDNLRSEANETFDVALDLATGATLGVPRTTIVTILDDDALSQNSIAFAETQISVNEADGLVSIDVIRTGDNNQTASVDYTTNDGTARANSDYVVTSGTLSFSPGETSKTITLPIHEDNLAEPTETLTLSLSNPQGISLGFQDTTTVAIIDNDEISDQFTQETIVSAIPRLTSFEWLLPETLLIANQDGLVQTFKNGEVLPQPFIDISEQVNSNGERGLMGLAVHPDFPNQPYVYLSFTYDPPETSLYTDAAGPDGGGGRVSRLIRVTADPTTNYTTALPNSELVLLGTNSTWENIGDPAAIKEKDVFPPLSCNDIEDCLPNEARLHAIGTLGFGSDGSLFVGVGDAGYAGRVDPQSTRAQDLDTLVGKLLRINPLTGEGYSDNPFYDGDPQSNRSKVYDYGLRNPFRFTLHPVTDEPFIGDVGWGRWEEINTGRGENFGWPYYEGGNGVSLTTNGYSSLPEAQEFYNSGQTVTPPVYGLSHDLGATAIILGDFYTGTNYPEIYQNALFYSDYDRVEDQARVDALIFDEFGNIESALGFTSVSQPGIVQMSVGPDGNMYFANRFTQEIGRWVFESETEEIERVIIGTSDNDVLKGTFKNERIDGLAGNDLITGKGGADIIDGGEGIDTITYNSSPDGVTINLATETAAGGDAEGDSISGIERIFGSNLADQLTGDDGDNLIEGNGGADTLEGGEGVDSLSYNSSPDGVTINLATETAAGGDAEGDLISGFEKVIGSKFADNLTGDDSPNYLQGKDGNDRLNGKGGADILMGGEGIDTITYIFSESGVTINLATETAAGGDAEGDSFSSIERIFGSNFADYLIGDDGDNWIEGNAGADILEGGEGVDSLSYNSSPEGVTINLATETAAGGEAEGDSFSGFERVIGSKFADRLIGDDGQNHLKGKDGNDTLNGGGGDDTLIGGNESDLFILSLDSGRDKITDFNPSEGDLLGLSDNLDFNNLSFSENNILVETQIIATLQEFDTTALTINNFAVI